MLREDLLDIIATALPDTPEVTEFCEGDFGVMLDKVMAKIQEYADSIFKVD